MKTLDGYELCLVDTEYDEPYNTGKELLHQGFFIVLDEPSGLEWWDSLEDTKVYTMEITRRNKMHSLLFVEKSEEVRNLYEEGLEDWAWNDVLCLARKDLTDVMVCTTKKELGYNPSIDLFMACILHNLYAFMDGYVKSLSPVEMVCLYY